MKNKLFASALCAAALFTTNAMAKDQELYFYNWSEYIPSEVCSGQLNLATALESAQNRRSDSFGLNPAL